MSLSIPDLTAVRARHPEAIAEAAARRVRRPLIGASGRLMIVAADHPARGALGVGDRRLADRKSTRLNSSHKDTSRMPSSA